MDGDKDTAALIAKVRAAGGDYSAKEIIRYTEIVGCSAERLAQMTGEEIIRAIDQGLNRVYQPRG